MLVLFATTQVFAAAHLECIALVDQVLAALVGVEHFLAKADIVTVSQSVHHVW